MMLRGTPHCDRHLLFIFLLIASFNGVANAKVVEGVLKLDSINTEAYLTKFAVNEGAQVSLNFALKSTPDYFHNYQHSLLLVILNEGKFEAFQDALKKGSLCEDRVFGATKSVIPRVLNNRAAASLSWEVSSHETFYVYITDCKLEFYDARGLPSAEYVLELKTASDSTSSHGHIPADEWGLLTFNVLMSWVLLGGFFYFMTKFLEEYKKQGVIHFFFLILMAAYILQIVALIFESLHLFKFSIDGKGFRWKYTIFALDFFSEISQGMSEHIISLLLVFLACGWTTLSLAEISSTSMAPSSDDSIMGALLKLQNEILKNPKVRTMVRKMTRTYGSPMQMFQKITLGSVFIVALTIVQLTLEMWGRRYHDQFSQFHDHEHWPGKLILFLRVLLWILFIFGSITTYSGNYSDTAAKTNTVRLALFGSIWLLAFPLAVFFAECLPARLRHRFVSVSCVLLQIAALQYLTYMSLFSKTFKKVSSVANPKRASTLPQKNFGIRSKVCFD